MPLKDKKKLTAAMSAVLYHIRSEQEALLTPPPELPERLPVSIWAANSRQTMMQNRSLMQLKGFHGFKTR